MRLMCSHNRDCPDCANLFDEFYKLTYGFNLAVIGSGLPFSRFTISLFSAAT